MEVINQCQSNYLSTYYAILQSDQQHINYSPFYILNNFASSLLTVAFQAQFFSVSGVQTGNKNVESFSCLCCE